MLINMNTNQSNQSFGALHISDEATRQIARRAGKKAEKVKVALQELFDDQRFNTSADVFIDAGLHQPGLRGRVVVPERAYESYKEGYWSTLFASPAKFIKKLCKRADRFKAMLKLEADVRNLK